MRPRLFGTLLIVGLGAGIYASAQGKAGTTGIAGPPPVHVRWIVDVKKTLGYQDFGRPVSKQETWKLQQGITFLTPDEVAIYQVIQAPPAPAPFVAQVSAPYALQVAILDAHDGHEIKSLQFPSKTEIAKLTPTRGGAFLLRTGDLLSLYSAKFEQVATRKLPAEKNTSVDDWQIDISPSGAQIILVHQQVWEDDKGKETSSRADVEVLDSQTFKNVKSLSVPRLEQWSAGDNLIVTTDPSDERSTSFGVLNFEGKWRPLKTSAETSNPQCPYRLEALEHQLFAAHDCDDLVVVSATGAEKFSRPVRSDDVLVSVAGADRYLAEALVEPQRSRAYINVYDLRRKTQVSWVSLEKKSIYYSISSAGALAAVDGDKIKLFEPTIPAESAGADPQQRWTIELIDKQGYESFDRDTSQRWMRQQDVRFISADQIAVYQVMQNEGDVPGQTSVSAGDTGFHVQVKVFSAKDGHEVKTLRLPATSQFTKLIPTHDGKFILRTGDVVNLYSANFEQLAWRSLPLNKIEGTEGWQVDVSPAGNQIVLVHQQRFAAKSVLIDQPAGGNEDHVDVEVLDADTLQPVKKFTVKSMRDNWSAADDYLVTAGFDPDKKKFGLLAFDGKWKEMKTPWDKLDSLCPSQMQALPQQRLAVVGCYFFGVLTSAGESLMGVKLDTLEISVAAGGGGEFVAMEVDKMQPGKRVADAIPNRLEVYDMKTKAKVISVPLTADNPYFDVSARGDFAVVQNDHLSLYFPKSN